MGKTLNTVGLSHLIGLIKNDMNKIDVRKVNRSDIANLSSITPVIVDSTELMTDQSKIYVLSTTGRIWTWVDGTITDSNMQYQASGISNEAITFTKLNQEIKEAILSEKNVHLSTDFTTIAYQANGTPFESVDWIDSTIINVTAGEKYTFNFTWADAAPALILMNNSNEVISTLLTGSGAAIEYKNYQLTIPENVTKLIFQAAKAYSYSVTKQTYGLNGNALNDRQIKESMLDLSLLSKIAKKIINTPDETLDGKYINVTESSSNYSDAGWLKSYEYNVVSGMTYYANGSVYDTASAAIVYLLNDGTFTYDKKGNGSLQKYVNYELNVPSNCVKIILCENKVEAYHAPTFIYHFELQSQDTANDNNIAFVGDSICQGVSNGGGYALLYAQHHTEVNVNNYGAGGTTFCNDAANNSISSLIEAIPNKNEVDKLIVIGGVNDYWGTHTLGTLTPDYDSSVDQTTTVGNLEYICRYIYHNFPNAKVGFIFPYRTKANTLIVQSNFWSKIKEVMIKYGIPFLNLYESCTVNPYISEHAKYFDEEGIHVNADGYIHSFPMVENFINSL